MARPGVEIVSRAAPPSRGVPSQTGLWFAVGLTERGRTDAPVLLNSLSDYTKHFGNRVAYSVLYDSVETYFREGGSQVYVARVVGPAATVDTLVLKDAANADSVAVDSIGGGATDLSVTVAAGSAAGTYTLQIFLAGVEVERSPDLAAPADAVTWAKDSIYIRARALGVVIPKPAGPTDLAAGADDRANVTDTQRIAALGLFSRALGPGQVTIPGATTETVYSGLLAHADANNRVALLDGADTGVVATLTAAANAIRVAVPVEQVERGALFGQWCVIPGLVRGTTRTIPPSPVVAALMSRTDGLTGNPNIPAAGPRGEARFVVDLSQPAFADADRETLNDAGVDLFRVVAGAVRLYGYRTLSLDPAWRSLAAARTRMAIEHAANEVGEQFMFSQLDGRGQKIAEFHGALTGMLAGFYALNALYGETSEQAFSVDTGSTVNTPDTLSNDELHAVIGIRTSPFAELVYIEIVKVPITEAL